MSTTQFGHLPALRLTCADGASALITLFGAQLVSWTTADGAEQLFCSQRSATDGSRAIRGGVPVIFPQFNERGPIIRHGFARLSHWTLEQRGTDGARSFAVLALTAAQLAPERAAEWPHEFVLRLRVAVGGDSLALTLDVDNTGSTPFDFSAALHSYHRVDDVAGVRITGVQAQPLMIGAALDAIYEGVAALSMRDGGRTLHSTQDGFSDAVVWNPGAAGSAAAVDMAVDDYRHFVCIEPAVIAPVTLAAGSRWRGHNTLRVRPSE